MDSLPTLVLDHSVPIEERLAPYSLEPVLANQASYISSRITEHGTITDTSARSGCDTDDSFSDSDEDIDALEKRLTAPKRVDTSKLTSNARIFKRAVKKTAMAVHAVKIDELSVQKDRGELFDSYRSINWHDHERRPSSSPHSPRTQFLVQTESAKCLPRPLMGIARRNVAPGISLRGQQIGDKYAQAVANRLTLSKRLVKRVDLHENRLSSTGVEAIASSLLRKNKDTLTSLVLSRNRLFAIEPSSALSSLFKSCKNLTRLDLRRSLSQATDKGG
jgi:hypothetical protein